MQVVDLSRGLTNGEWGGHCFVFERPVSDNIRISRFPNYCQPSSDVTNMIRVYSIVDKGKAGTPPLV